MFTLISGNDPFPLIKPGNMSEHFGHFVWELVKEIMDKVLHRPLIGHFDILCPVNGLTGTGTTTVTRPKEDYNTCRVIFPNSSSSRVYFVFVLHILGDCCCSGCFAILLLNSVSRWLGRWYYFSIHCQSCKSPENFADPSKASVTPQLDGRRWNSDRDPISSFNFHVPSS